MTVAELGVRSAPYGGRMNAARIAFYATSATVIPVIMLAFFLQIRGENLFVKVEPGVSTLHFAVLLCAVALPIVVMGIAESFSLFALSRPSDDAFTLQTVRVGDACALGLFFIGSLGLVIDRLLADVIPKSDKRQEPADGAAQEGTSSGRT